MQKVGNFTKEHIAVILIVVCSLLAYGVMVPWLGLYTDDWTFLSAYHNFGSQGLFDYFQLHRPVWGLTYQIAMPLLGTKAWVWNLYGIFWRVTASLSFYWLLRLVWPQRKKFALMAGVLFAIYPGYLLQPLSLVMGQVVMVYAVFILSLVFTVLAIQNTKHKIVFTILAMFGSLFNITAMEYFLPLEVIRLVLIYVVLPGNRKPSKRFFDSLKLWLPYAVVLLAVAIYRVFFYKDQTNIYSMVLLNALKANAFTALVQLVKDILNSIYQASIYAWVQPLGSLFTAVRHLNKLNLIILGFSGAVFLVVLFAALRLIKREPQPGRSGIDWTPLIVSLIALFIAGWPFYITGLKVLPSGFYSRFTLPFIFGAAILVAFILDLIKINWASALVFSILVSSGIGYHFTSQNSLRMVTVDNTRTVYELLWRIPGLQPGSTLVVNEGSEYFTYSTLAAQLNLLYPLQPGEKISYGWFWPKELSQLTSNPITAGQNFTEGLIPYPFSGNTSRLIAIQTLPDACLRVIAPESIKVEKSLVNYGVSSISDPSLINLNDQQKALEIQAFGPEPAHGWCYYFEKTDLALQKGDLASIVENYAQVQKQSLKALQPVEWLPYIEGLGRAGKVSDALGISQQLLTEQKSDKPLTDGVCSTWSRIKVSNPSSAVTTAMTQLACP
jgi:hypothetical protein